MANPKSYLAKKAAKKAAKVTLKHAAHGTATKAKRRPIRSVTLLLTGAAAGSSVSFAIARRATRRRLHAEKVAADAAAVVAADQERAAARHERRRAELDDRTLTDRVKSEIFRPADSPKGDVVVDSENGVVHLRGSVATAELRDRLVGDASAVDGVQRVENLLSVRD
ncbi:BON domain-containing protein [Patulibacter sp.]|uniref:BON domain-containing protein n=1 Tax=Patulibacter sp. TaxID=1912859 RepID=UPI0027260D58|nr:BON domain-containing protein [Patulibacter sp.]MDO9408398.1 BON domain-containing protein [Patulibacter sp.]